MLTDTTKAIKKQTLQPEYAAQVMPVAKPDPSRVAVILNRNARQVSDRLAKRVERIVGKDNLFYSRSLDEAEAFSREIVQRGYGTVVCGGGDGTLCGAVNMVQRYIQESNRWRQERFVRYGERQSLLSAPRFGFLRLGTGNGISPVVGARRPLDDLKRIVDYAPSRTRRVDLIESEGERFFFSGMGYDSVLLNDYNWLKSRTKSRLLKPVMHSVMGYFAALFARTLPAYMFGKAPKLDVRIVTTKSAYYVDPRRGDCVEELPAGEVLFEGNASMVAAGTTPFYGYRLKIFPFACMAPGHMNLRVATIGPISSLVHLPAIWRGHYRHPKTILDFLVRGLRIELQSPYPFQHSGDSQGPKDAVDLEVSETGLELVDLHQPRRLS